jgi:hypothetical protein
MYPYIDAKIKLYLIRNLAVSNVITLESSPSIVENHQGKS